MKELTVKSYLDNPVVQERVSNLLKDRASQFLTSVMASVNSNPALAECHPASVLNAAMTAASMDLPVNQNLGFAYMVPYNDKKLGKVAQFQMGAKGFKQLAIRTGKYKTINETDVREGEYIEVDRLTGEYIFDWVKDEAQREQLPIIGYVAYFELTTGFKKSLYMTASGMENHGKKYSQTYKKGYGNWADDFDAMARKTVVKLLLSKWGLLSIELEKAIEADQSVVDGDKHFYVDAKPSEPSAQEKEEIRVREYIEAATVASELSTACSGYISELEAGHELIKLYEQKMEELENV